ncbi:hypothetical protein KDW98_12415 [Burkholderia vietnamiensis]|uniref:hypothetical protein n=1 Tax=Burkholderia vietnamiensis TaxID=60552 RepID=UPI001B997F60|nr:hypothetical protein [Burkholderia vietnamiensis]MBR8161966.1 hypothetical protein [Burkholderia vietnamiensis]
MASILPNGKTQFVDQNGKPLVGGSVAFYAPGTTMKQDTWRDQAQTLVNTNPVVLDSRGQATIWGTGSYRQVVTDKFGVVIWDQVISDPSQAITDFIAQFSQSNGASLVGFTQTGSGAVPRTLQDKERESPSVMDWGATGGNESKDTLGFIAAINWAIANYPATIRIPAGSYLLGQGLPKITRPIRIIGDGWRSSLVQFTPDATGKMLVVQDCGFGANSTDYPIAGMQALSSPTLAQAGFTMHGINWSGNRSVSQEGLILAGDNDHIDVHDCVFAYFNGRGLGAGDTSIATGQRGALRESNISRIKVRNCGSAAGTASMSVNLLDQISGEDSSNLNHFSEIDIVFPYGRALEVVDSRTVNSGSNLYGMKFDKIMIHGRTDAAMSSQPQLLVQGNIGGCEFDVKFAYNGSPSPSVMLTQNASINTMPADNHFDLWFGNVMQGVDVQYSRGSSFNFRNGLTSQQILTAETTTTGPVTIICDSNQPFLALPGTTTLNGTAPVVLNGLNASTPGITTFMPYVNSGGVGDTTRATLPTGITGTITRVSTAQYTFTPDSASTATIQAGAFMTKFVVPASTMPVVRGRFVNTPYQPLGIASPGFQVPNQGPLSFDIGNGGGAYQCVLRANSSGVLQLIAVDNTGAQKVLMNFTNNVAAPGAAIVSGDLTFFSGTYPNLQDVATSANVGAASPLPAAPVGYAKIKVGGNVMSIPYYNP